jgi:hypothetical protein
MDFVSYYFINLSVNCSYWFTGLIRFGWYIAYNPTVDIEIHLTVFFTFIMRFYLLKYYLSAK